MTGNYHFLIGMTFAIGLAVVTFIGASTAYFSRARVSRIFPTIAIVAIVAALISTGLLACTVPFRKTNLWWIAFVPVFMATLALLITSETHPEMLALRRQYQVQLIPLWKRLPVLISMLCLMVFSVSTIHWFAFYYSLWNGNWGQDIIFSYWDDALQCLALLLMFIVVAWLYYRRYRASISLLILSLGIALGAFFYDTYHHQGAQGVMRPVGSLYDRYLYVTWWWYY